MNRLRHTPPQDDHERQIVVEVERAQKALEAAYGICQRRASVRNEDGGSLRLRYKDTARSLEALLTNLRSVRGFGAMPQPETTATPKLKESNADAKRRSR